MRQATFLVSLGVIVLALAGWYWSTGPKADPKAGKILFHQAPCPKCGTVISYLVADVGKRGQCSKCGHHFTFPKPDSGRGHSILILGVMIGLVLVLLGAWGFVTRGRRLEEEHSYLFRCNGCKAKLRYSLRQAGLQGACPRCDRVLTFPPV